MKKERNVRFSYVRRRQNVLLAREGAEWLGGGSESLSTGGNYDHEVDGNDLL